MVFLRFLFPMSFQKPIQKLGMDVCEVWQLKFWRKIQKWKICSKMTFCMNVSRFMNLAAIFSLDLESQYMEIAWFSENVSGACLLNEILRQNLTLKLRFKIKWKNGGQIHETWHIHTDGYFQTNFSFLHFLSKFQLPHLTNIHAELLYWFLEWHWR